MAITVTTNQTESVEKIKYPILGIFPNGTIVLFSSETSSTILKGESKDYIGLDWNLQKNRYMLDTWVPYHGTVTLSNETL
jgi:hypothetical protein